MKNFHLLTAFVVITLFTAVVACKKQFQQPQPAYLQSQAEYQRLIESNVYPFDRIKCTPELIWNDQGKLIGYKNAQDLHRLPFADWLAFDKLVMGVIPRYDIDGLTEAQLSVLPVNLIEAHNESLPQGKEMGGPIKKIWRVPDCETDPKICPCKDTNIPDCTCIETSGTSK